MKWICTDKSIEYKKNIVIMGIVNITPDSFSDGGDFLQCEKAVNHAIELENQGADIIDLGAQSTRPGHIPVSAKEEWQRLQPVLCQLRDKTDLPISIDTYYPFVAKSALQAGADIINDVSGDVNKEMAQIISAYSAGWIIMHSTAGDVEDVKEFFENSVKKAISFGVKKDCICLDMGIGFGKNYQQDMSLLANVAKYKRDDLPLLLGTSRKRVIGKAGEEENPKERVYGNIAADTAAVLGGVDIIRIHDVKVERQGIITAEKLRLFVR